MLGAFASLNICESDDEISKELEAVKIIENAYFNYKNKDKKTMEGTSSSKPFNDKFTYFENMDDVKGVFCIDDKIILTYHNDKSLKMWDYKTCNFVKSTKSDFSIEDLFSMIASPLGISIILKIFEGKNFKVVSLKL